MKIKIKIIAEYFLLCMLQPLTDFYLESSEGVVTRNYADHSSYFYLIALAPQPTPPRLPSVKKTILSSLHVN
jgi:hypothetical protein